jgi:D-3-phosphoglycerate dehydrogenase / 2-oxoglutarate reductase
MKVLVADKFEQSGLDGLNALGVEVRYSPDLADESLGQALKEQGANVLIVRSTKVTEPMMDGSALKFIVRAGAGYNTIDVAAATQRDIKVANCPGKNSVAVAELAFGLILALDRRIPDNVSELRAGKWNKKRFSKAKGLFGRTLGLIGMGSIGREMIPRAKAFGMNVLVYSRSMTDAEASQLGVKKVATLEELASGSDVVSVHVSLTPETKNSLGEAFFAAMQPGSFFVNTSRGEVVDQVALIKAIEEKGIMAGLDVFADEPAGGEAEYHGALKDNASVYCTHHIGASTDQAQEAVAAETVRIVDEFKRTGVAPNVVN